MKLGEIATWRGAHPSLNEPGHISPSGEGKTSSQVRKEMSTQDMLGIAREIIARKREEIFEKIKEVSLQKAAKFSLGFYEIKNVVDLDKILERGWTIDDIVIKSFGNFYDKIYLVTPSGLEAEIILSFRINEELSKEEFNEYLRILGKLEEEKKRRYEEMKRREEEERKRREEEERKREEEEKKKMREYPKKGEIEHMVTLTLRPDNFVVKITTRAFVHPTPDEVLSDYIQDYEDFYYNEVEKALKYIEEKMKEHEKELREWQNNVINVIKSIESKVEELEVIVEDIEDDC